MLDNNMTGVYFSPSGTAKKTLEVFASGISGHSRPRLYDFRECPLSYGPEDFFAAVFPVFSGRLPEVCAESLRKISGNGARASAIVVYGNRDFDDALLELKDILESCGFSVIAGAAVVAEHSIFKSVGACRPDASDIELIKAFAGDVSHKLEQGVRESVDVDGKAPYREIMEAPLKPAAAKSKCSKCGVCAKVCPVAAIEADSPWKTDKAKCISCTACISACPENLRSFSKIPLALAEKVFAGKFSKRREPKIYL